MKSLCAGLLAVIVAAACTHAIQVEDPSGEEIPPPTPAPASVEALAPVGIERAFPGLSLRGMVAMAFPDDGSDRLYVAQKHGVIAVFPNDQAADWAATFLDITDRVSDRGSEEGLLGLAFDPGFAESGYLYVYYSASGPRRIVVSRFQAAGVGQASPTLTASTLSWRCRSPTAITTAGSWPSGLTPTSMQA